LWPRSEKPGKRKCAASLYQTLCNRIEKVNISLTFLVCGFDDEGSGHIYSVDGKDAPKCHDSVGMWAIGSGAHAALSSLAFHLNKAQLNLTTSVEKATYLAIAAKFMAESSSEVGKEATNVTLALRPAPRE
jgi:20S proteasome alpha/beta subunit